MFQFEADDCPMSDVGLGLAPELFVTNDEFQATAAAVASTMTKSSNEIDILFADQEVSSSCWQREESTTYNSHDYLNSQLGADQGTILDGILSSVGKPSDVTGQRLVTPIELDIQMAEDKNQALQELINMNIETTVETMSNVQNVIEEEDPAQSLMKELEEFMDSFVEADNQDDVSQFFNTEQGTFSQELLNQEQEGNLKQLDTSCPIANNTITEEEAKAADDLLDALLKGEINFSQTPNILEDSGYQSDNTSSVEAKEHMTTVSTFRPIAPKHQEQPQTVVIIAPEDLSNEVKVFNIAQPVQLQPVVIPAVRKLKRVEVKSPKSPIVTSGRVTKRSKPTQEERKERKKQQNVEAARRYRDKKKSEHQQAETAEHELLEKNRELKAKHEEIANEVKTMRKLMIELGVLKVVKN